jgi:hypothetical protein
MGSNNKKKVEYPNVNTTLKYPVPIRPKPAILEQNPILPSISPVELTSEPASTSKEATIDLTVRISSFILTFILFNISF